MRAQGAAQDAAEAAAVASQAARLAVALQEYLEANHMTATQALLQVRGWDCWGSLSEMVVGTCWRPVVRPLLAMCW